MSPKRVLILATTTGYQTRAFGEAANRLGVELVFATDRCHLIDDPWRDRAIPIRFYDEPGSVAAILEAAALQPLDGVLALGDRPTAIAAHVAAKFGLRGHSVAAVTIARDKWKTRECFARASLPAPWFQLVSLSADPAALSRAIEYPCVVKPLALSGSRGVIRADGEDGFVSAFGRVQALLRSPEVRAERNQAHEQLLVEGYVPGREYALEGLCRQGRLHTLALFDKPEPLEGPFFEETVYVTPSAAPAHEQTAIVTAVTRAVEAIGLTAGPVHAECRVNDHGVFVLEVAARPIGGLCARALRFARSSGATAALIPFEELLLRHVLGEPAETGVREEGASGVMMIPIPRPGILRNVEGIGEGAVAGVDDVRITAKPDQLLVPLPEGASYLGFIFAHGDRPSDVNLSLQASHARLHFDIDAKIPIVAGPLRS